MPRVHVGAGCHNPHSQSRSQGSRRSERAASSYLLGHTSKHTRRSILYPAPIRGTRTWHVARGDGLTRADPATQHTPSARLMLAAGVARAPSAAVPALRLRADTAGPASDTAASSSSSVDNGACVTVLREEGGFALVRTAEGEEGWIRSDHMAPLAISPRLAEMVSDGVILV